MADRKLYDYDGNVIPTEPTKKLYNFEGEPLKFASSLPSDNTIGRHLVEALPMAGAIAGGTLGPLGGAAGTGLGTMVKQSLQKLRPDLLGSAPQGGEEIAADTGKELLLNNVLPGILGKVGSLATRVGMQGSGATAAIGLSHFPAVREGAVKRMTGQIQEQLGQVGNLEAFPTQEVSVTPGKEFRPFRKGQPFQMPTKPVVTVSSKPTLGENEFVNLMSKDKVNVDKALEEFTGKNASRYAEIMSPETYSSVRDMLGTMQEMQKKTTLDRIITYRQGRLVWGAGMGALAALGHPGTALLGEGLREGPVVLNAMLDKIMANPETAKLVTAALRTPAKAPQADLINKALTVALPRLFLEGTGVDTTSGQ